MLDAEIPGSACGSHPALHHVYGEPRPETKPQCFLPACHPAGAFRGSILFPGMLNSMDEKELTVMKYTAEGLQKARETEDA